MLLINVGYLAVCLVIRAQAMAGVTSALTIPEWIVISAYVLLAALTPGTARLMARQHRQDRGAVALSGLAR